MEAPRKDQRDKSKTLLILLLLIVALLVAYLLYRSSQKATPVIEAEPTPPPAVTEVVVETPVPSTPTPRPQPTTVAVVTPVPTCPPAGQPPACKDWIVFVRSDANVDPEIVCVGITNTVIWKQLDNLNMRLYFPTSGFPPNAPTNIGPFLDMKQDLTGGKNEWVFQHPGTSTVSAKPNPSLPSGRYCFKYDQEVSGRRIDGRIIIQK